MSDTTILFLAVIYIFVGLAFVAEVEEEGDGILVILAGLLAWPMELGHLLGIHAKSRQGKKLAGRGQSGD